MEFPKRKSPRLQNFDYGPGYYSVTVCTQDKRCILSDILVGEELAPPVLKLSPLGKIVAAQIESLSERFPALLVENYVIMPNHVHLLLKLGAAGGASPSPTLPDVMRVFKSQVTRLGGEGVLFQRSYHDHVIRGEQDYREIWAYIDENPAKWAEDCFYRK